ncbi:DNA alkylation repair protein [Streptococcus suis]|uniref:DNA alkylation repair protein n=1 Tax=Streptococcus suis TaxID=1307 RepID=UPI0025AEF1E9|nr:DNA alkylation repair protein [Streptococcus suis]MDN2964063.1 DNA alkylation repair protein [Streptococcus suis]
MTEMNIILTQLEVASHAGTLKRYEKIGETKPYYGVPMGAISGIAKAYKNRLDLFAPLWQTGVLEAQYLAIQVAKAKPNQLPQADLENCLNEQISVNVLDKLASIILSKRKERILTHPRPGYFSTIRLVPSCQILCWKNCLKSRNRRISRPYSPAFANR